MVEENEADVCNECDAAVAVGCVCDAAAGGNVNAAVYRAGDGAADGM